MRFFINGEEKNLSEEEARELEQTVKANADEITQAAVRKVEPFTRMTTVLGFTFAAVFFWVKLLQGRYEDGTVWLLFFRVEAMPIVYILAAVMTVVALRYWVSIIRFFINKK